MRMTTLGMARPTPPSPGTPGEGRGEGSASSTRSPQSKIRNWIDPHPNPLPEYRERGQARPARLARAIARTALGVVWVYEGLVPKLLFTTQQEIDLVARSGAYWPTPVATLAALGVCEVLGGLWLLSGRAQRTALSFALVAILGPVCAVLEPSILYHPFGGLSKNLSLLACAAVVWLLAEDKPAPVSSENEKGVEPCCA